MLETILSLALLLQGDLPEIEPADDLVITESVRVKPGTYLIRDQGTPGVLQIQGENVLVVLDGVEIVGSEPDQDRDGFSGIGLTVKGNGNIVHGGALRGFKVAVQVDGGEEHWLMGLDVSGNFAQRLKSTPEGEVASDWLWPHANDEGEWAKNYGAGIWVKGAKNVRILDSKGHGSQNGILLDRTTDSLVRGCDFSFNSGWGIALWRSSDNRIESNDFDWCVRGYSHGVYDRGQDSAGILVFEQSHRNVFRQNTATHSGDGFFLYAGHETTKGTGEGGCNDNVVEENDFSHSVANGIEATFSKGNRFTKNVVDDCNYGIWAGYSRESVFESNIARNCTYAGIAIEHGSKNVIRGNLIEDSRRGVWLWWDEDKEFLESVYGKKNRTDSADTEILGNVIHGGEAGIFLDTSTGIRVLGNFIEGAGEEVVTEGECEGLTVEAAEAPPELFLLDVPPPFEPGHGRQFILVTEWGPYDFGSPLLHPARIEGVSRARFYVLGAGKEEVSLGEPEGAVTAVLRRPRPGETVLDVSPSPDAGAYVPFSVKVHVGETEFAASGILLNLSWRVRFWKWETDPRESEEDFAKLLGTPPLVERRVRQIDFSWQGKGPGGQVPADGFVTVAETTATLPAGEYEFVTVSDDGVRLTIDDKRVIDNWTLHGPTEDTARVTLEAGEHRIRLEHFEIDGWAWLFLTIRMSE